MQIDFYKYQGTGNDFILIDDRNLQFPFQDHELIRQLCAPKFGIGADGLMLLRNSAKENFTMWYANSNGLESTMCGNGGRCISAFAKSLGIFTEVATFDAVDGVHHAIVKNDFVELKMNDVNEIIQLNENSFQLNTGSPHLVYFVDSVKEIDVFNIGRNTQKMPEYPKGINVNFVDIISSEKNNLKINIRTYERGVEDETLSCGTGATAAAIALLAKNKLATGNYEVKLTTLGGDLTVKCNINSDFTFDNLWLCGTAKKVFKGQIEI